MCLRRKDQPQSKDPAIPDLGAAMSRSFHHERMQYREYALLGSFHRMRARGPSTPWVLRVPRSTHSAQDDNANGIPTIDLVLLTLQPLCRSLSAFYVQALHVYLMAPNFVANCFDMVRAGFTNNYLFHDSDTLADHRPLN